MAQDLPRRVATVLGELGLAGASVLRGATHAAVRRAEESRLAAGRAAERRREFERRLRERRAQRRRRERERRLAAADPWLGWALVGLALLMLAVALVSRRPGLVVVWLALLPGIRGLRIVRHHARARPSAPPGDRVDLLCRRLQATICGLPEPLRSAFGRPEVTIEELRRSVGELSRREGQLRAAAHEVPHAALERARLVARVEAAPASDAGARTRLLLALEALDRRRDDAAKALALADRMEADRQRLTWSLEGLWLQAVRLAAAGPEAHSPDALLDGLRRLRTELDALADAREAAP